MTNQNKASPEYKLLIDDWKSEPSVSSNLEDAYSSFRIPFGKFALVTVSLPLGAFVFCVIWSIIFNFKQTTATHCNVPNFLPSMSAATGSNSPQKYVWRLAIALHGSPRYLVAFMYYWKHRSKSVLTLNWLELSGLLGLTFISSTENYPLHAKCFVTFMISALVYMFLVSYASHFNQYRKTRQTKRYLAWTNLIGGALAVYFFMRHNSYCEPGMYTLFALSEYVIVTSNIMFHFQAYYDLSNIDFIAKPGKSFAEQYA
ncbi:Post-GPI attachment to proteins factor 2 [Halotydeus destructor]|nr:Post-GPI attachment to proteins factor 2 [Halotydeus destructor]